MSRRAAPKAHGTTAPRHHGTTARSAELTTLKAARLRLCVRWETALRGG